MQRLIFLAFIFTVSSAVVPMTGRRQIVAIPYSQIITLSAESYSHVLAEGKLSTNSSYVSSVRKVGERLTVAVEAYLKQNKLASVTEAYDWQYNVLVSDALNAFCMPGGQIAAKSASRPPQFLSTHPDPSDRIANLNRIMPKAMEYYKAR